MSIFIDHPRPDFARPENWHSLNGPWAFKPDPENQGLAQRWFDPGAVAFDRTIRVPFAWETPASGIQLEWMPIGWYRLSITRPGGWEGLRTVLHVGAAHYHCQAWLNGEWLGEHFGGYLPFELDLSEHLADGQGVLVLRVEAPVDKRFIPHGKQRSHPPDDYNDCAFTASSGIWQPVWLEARPATYLEGIVLRPDTELTGFTARVSLRGSGLDHATLRILVDGEDPLSLEVGGKMEMPVDLPLSKPHLWQPADPHLYAVDLELESRDGIDRVTSYTGLRAFTIRDGRFYLNGERIYLRGALDQGYWPHTGYTAPDDTALRRDVELAQSAGYNLIRKHIKLEDPRWLYWADRLGLLVWEEPPCVGRYSPQALSAFEAQFAPMVARDGNHPSIILWGIYNEEWGLDWRLAEHPDMPTDVARAYDRLAALDHSRPILDNSGWWHVKTDVVDWHYYDEDMRSWMQVSAALAADPHAWFGHRLSDTRWYETQFWVPGCEVPNLPLMNGEYGGGSPHNQGWLFRWQTQDLRRHAALNGYIYTEFYDVEHEKVGIYTADRQLKALGCDPATLNAETVILFDLIPESPEADMVVGESEFQLDVLLSHHGSQPVRGQLVWGWTDEHWEGAAWVEVKPFEHSQPLPIVAHLPEGTQTGQLQVRFLGDDNRCHAYGFINVSR
jgi:beta-galactosidase/beta-glucuronidase